MFLGFNKVFIINILLLMLDGFSSALCTPHPRLVFLELLVVLVMAVVLVPGI